LDSLFTWATQKEERKRKFLAAFEPRPAARRPPRRSCRRSWSKISGLKSCLPDADQVSDQKHDSPRWPNMRAETETAEMSFKHRLTGAVEVLRISQRR
jgi:hypothetical protein